MENRISQNGQGNKQPQNLSALKQGLSFCLFVYTTYLLHVVIQGPKLTEAPSSYNSNISKTSLHGLPCRKKEVWVLTTGN